MLLLGYKIIIIKGDFYGKETFTDGYYYGK